MSGIETFIIKQASAEHPRHSEGAMLELKDGRLLLIWQEFLASEQGGEDNAPSQLSCMESSDGGRTWDHYRVLVHSEPGDVNVYSPNLVRLPTGEIAFLFMRYHSIYPHNTSGFIWISDDEGQTFKPYATAWERNANSLCAATIRLLSDGRIIVPMCREVFENGQGTNRYCVGSIYSDNGGKTWHESNNWIDLPLRGCMEPHIAQLRDGSLLMIMRTQMGAVFQSRSTDGGATWSAPQTTGLRSPESCPELINLPSGDLLVVWNNAPYNPDWYSHFGKRTPLTVAVSHNDGKSWSDPLDIETNPDWAFSNPGAIVLSNETIFMNYWACEYEPSGLMGVDRIDLRGAIIPLSILPD